ncbi:MAG: peptide ABC transporter substrate-binding protein [Rhodospirillaceae bacterium]|nr:peptide ABC transporter substrate-binding protein [Rhodospirillaceae bacterium]
MNSVRKGFWPRLYAGLMLALLALPFAATDAAAKMVFNRGSSAEPDTLDPHKSSGNTASIVLADLMLGLMTSDPAGDVTLGAAEKVDISPDGLVYTFTLRPGLAWSDGTPLTAEDFVYSFRRVQDPATAFRYAQWMWAVKNAEAINRGKMPKEELGVRAVDARTFEMTLSAPNPVILEILTSLAGYPVPRHVVEKFGPEWTAPGNLVSNGAYVLKDRVPQTRVTLAKNPLFYDAANVKIDEVNFFPTENLGTVLNRFRAGELDVALNFPPEQLDWLKENLPKELRITPNLGVYYFLINNAKPPFNDVRVRKALSMAIDREGMVEKLFPTGVTPAYSLVPPVVSNYTVYKAKISEMPMPARLGEAKKLLAEAGFGADKPLKFTLQFDTLEENRKMAVAMASMWRPLGVQVELANSEFRDVQRRARTGDYDVMRFAYFSPFADASAYLNLYRTKDASNFAGFSDAAFDAAMAEANTVADMARRAAAMRKAEEVLMETYAIMPIYHYAGRRLVHQYVKGWVDNARNQNLSRYLAIEKPE